MKTITIGEGLGRSTVWETVDGWRYDGPACNGPLHVRTSGRGPWWKGPTDAKHVKALVRNAKKAGIPVREESDV